MATYKFTLRDKSVVFPKSALDIFQKTLDRQIQLLRQPVFSHLCVGFGELALTESEHAWLKKTCPYFTDEYLSYLRGYRFKPEQVCVKFVPTSADGETGIIEMDASGSWLDTIFWEVPLMATLSEVYFQYVATDWSYDGQQGRYLLEVYLFCINSTLHSPCL
jgi:nicotinate phosphoribosyltransferase